MILIEILTKLLGSLNNSENIFGTFFKLCFLIIVIPICLKYLYYTKTKFEKTITIKKKYKQLNSSDTDYDDILKVVDSEDNIYNVTNLFFKLDFNKEEDYKTLELGKKYFVKGYGIENSGLGLYKNIYEVHKLI